jgi:predicted DsbA family dithiol-disulfide isomerase
VLEVAAAVGLDIDQMRTDMKDSAINGDLDKNTKLGELLHITGTPGFVCWRPGGDRCHRAERTSRR